MLFEPMFKHFELSGRTSPGVLLVCKADVVHLGFERDLLLRPVGKPGMLRKEVELSEATPLHPEPLLHDPEPSEKPNARSTLADPGLLHSCLASSKCPQSPTSQRQNTRFANFPAYHCTVPVGSSVRTQPR